MEFVAGIRHNRNVYINYQFDIDNGDFYVVVELKNDEGNLQVVTGQVTWDEE